MPLQATVCLVGWATILNVLFFNHGGLLEKQKSPSKGSYPLHPVDRNLSVHGLQLLRQITPSPITHCIYLIIALGRTQPNQVPFGAKKMLPAPMPNFDT